MIEQQRSQDERTWGMLAHLSALTVLITGIGVLGPLVVWLIKKDQYPFVNDQGKEAINFHLTMLIGMAISLPLMCVGIGFITALIIGLIELVFSIIAAVQANNGVLYRYPLTLRLVK